MKKAPEIAVLAAFTKKNQVIGNQGKIPWNLPSERDRFKKICNGKIVIMGRKTFEEIGHALPYCTILILSKTIKTKPENCLLASSLETAIETVVKKNSSTEILIAGGQELYEKALPFAKKIYGTVIDADFEGDRFFPKIDNSWKKSVEESKEENGIKYQYVTYYR